MYLFFSKILQIQTFTDIKKFYFKTKSLASEIVIFSLQRPPKIWSTILSDDVK